MKIALITDQHFGIKNDSTIFLDYQKKFYDEVFFPYLKKNNITEVIDLGDTFDRRKYINYNTLAHTKDFYFDKLKDGGINLHIIVGNHSTFFRNHNDINSPDLLLCEYLNIKNYSNPQHVTFDGTKILIMPWINQSNFEECNSVMADSDSQIMFGHFELSGESLKRNFAFRDGISLGQMKKFEYVFSGHYHHKITKHNFKYLGTPYQLDWDDVDSEKGFYVFDTNTRDITFIKNPLKIYKKVIWEDDGTYDVKKIVDDTLNNSEAYKEKYVKVVVRRKANPYILDRFIEAIEKCSPHYVIPEECGISVNDTEEDIEEIEDTLTSITKYVEALNLDQKEKVLYCMRELHTEAKNLEES